MKRRQLLPLAASAAAALLLAAPLATHAAGEVKIALIASKTGPLEAYAKQTITGFMMGLDYATGGTMMVAGRTSWLQARIANIAVWPLLCAIMLAKAWPTGPSVRPIRISGIASVNWPSRASTVASPAWKT